jgi:Domain of unknown function (DUF5623)
MSIEAIRPSNLDGIKRLAKRIKTERNIRHSLALDAAANFAGFQNFRHAQNVLKRRPTTKPSHSVFVTAYWRDEESGSQGRETKAVELSASWGDLATAAQLRNDRTLGMFKPEGPDHLVRRYLSSSQSLAQDAVQAAERTLQFMDATKLRPSRSERGDISSMMPGRDHHSVWMDPASKRHLVTDEPYMPAVEGRANERTQWAEARGLTIVKSSWPGMYNPDGGSQLFLVAESVKGVPLGHVEAALARIPTASGSWDGISAPAAPAFHSPGTIALLRRPRRATATKPRATGPENTVPYSMVITGRSRRPKATAPLSVHSELGGLIKSVLSATYYRKGVYNRLNSVRCTLDDWTQCEYPDDSGLKLDRLNELYYRDSGGTYARSITADERHRHLDSLSRVKALLTEHYPTSTPLRQVLTKVDGAIGSLQRWE